MDSQDELDEIILHFQNEVQDMIKEFYATWNWDAPYYVAPPPQPAGVPYGNPPSRPALLGLPGR